MIERQTLATVAATLGALAALSSIVDRRPAGAIDPAALAQEIEAERDHVDAIELVAWIRDRKPGLRVVDVRPASEFDGDHIPTAENIALGTLARAPFDDDGTVVLISAGGVHAGQAWVLLRALGHPHVFFLRDGMDEWNEAVLHPTLDERASPDEERAFTRAAAVSRYFGGQPRRVTSGVDAPAGAPRHRPAAAPRPSSPSVNSPVPSNAPSPPSRRGRGC